MKKNITTLLIFLVFISGCTPILTSPFIVNEAEKIEGEVIDDVIKEEEKNLPKK